MDLATFSIIRPVVGVRAKRKEGNRTADLQFTSSVSMPDSASAGGIAGTQTVLENSLIVLDTAPGAYVRFDSDCRLTFVNQAAQTLLGKTRAELLGKMLSDVYPVSTGARLEESCRRAMAEHHAVSLEHYSEHWRRWYVIHALPDSWGGIVVQLSDITDRKLMEDAVRKSEEKFSKAFHSNPAAITIDDLTNRSFLEVNEAFEEMTGYRRDDVVGRDWAELALLADPNDWDKTIAQVVREGRLRNAEFHFRKKNGDSGAGLLSAELIEVDGKPCAITAIVDITERLQLESQLRQAQKLESVGRLAGGVAHDFNNLLTLINSYSSSILKELRPSDPLYPYAEEIKRAGEHAAGLTKQLLTFSRKQFIQPRPLDMNTIVNDAERMLQRLIGEDIELVTTLDPLLGQVMADPDQIHQVIMNLVVNARDAMPEGGKLEITTKNIDVDEGSMAVHPDAGPGRYVLMTITDTGIGMDEHTLQSAFEPFFTTKQPGAGTGLGLSTVYGIVRQSGGGIHVRSEVGQGTSCRIYLPRIEAPSVPDRAESDRAKARYGSETVLVVEDNEAVRRLTQTILKTYGYHVLEAANSTEAFAIEKEHSGEIHLLLTDVILPGMNGKALSERLRALRPRLKVLFTSGYTADVIARRGVLQRDVAYLPKPFGPESLAAKVREVLTEPSVAHPTGSSSVC
jgi:two-component system cell cycle sensor histidine kinase/response regulator CckA